MPSQARVVNRIRVRHHGAYNQIGGAVRTHVSGRRVHTFYCPPNGLHILSPRFSLFARNYYPGLGPSYVGSNPLGFTCYSA